MKIVGFVLLAVLLIILGPHLLIWALNTLVPTLGIEHTAWNWLAALVVMMMLRGGK
jgi:hypothetical protein